MSDCISRFLNNIIIKFTCNNDYSHLYGNKCNFCRKSIILDENSNDNIYFYNIFGLGKHDKKTICHKCLLKKFDKV